MSNRADAFPVDLHLIDNADGLAVHIDDLPVEQVRAQVDPTGAGTTVSERTHTCRLPAVNAVETPTACLVRAMPRYPLCIPKGQTMDPLAVLAEEHKTISSLVSTIETLPDDLFGGETRSDVATALVMVTSAHEAVEEQWFWPVVRQLVEHGKSLAGHAVDQETELKTLLGLVADTVPGTSSFADAMARFADAVVEHMSYEESVVWPAVRASMSAPDLDALFDAMRVAAHMAPTRPHAWLPPGGFAQNSIGLAVALTDKLRDRVTGRGQIMADHVALTR
ncbi:hemerythrin domain-containing protein [Gordonia sp. TBRC 11910]|uniref:Hemerythrin domain-containing protein n=1 Tax=Gordonia asplenii TaxID=2725283 RepID=A0A848KY82_9ACTN|nr:hemerythrin domain-containing protein [Gordonia asplenii]NMO01815.1 hemerythrin domain-containing protein [Gordonia asplenii]